MAEDDHYQSQELAISQTLSRDPEQMVQVIEHENSGSIEVQEPVVSEIQLQHPARPLVTIVPRENALLSSQTAARLLPHLPPYEWSFWTDASLPGPRRPKPIKLAGCGFCVVHRRLDNSKPGDRDVATTWWQSCFVARNVHKIGDGEMLAVAQALAMAVDQCKRISSTVVDRAGINMPGMAEVIKCQVISDPWPMPKVVNIFTDDRKVLDCINTCWLSGREAGLRSPMRHANAMIERLSDFGVRVHLQLVPGHSSDIHNRWAHEGARNALNPQYNVQQVCTTKRQPRAHRRPHKDETMQKAFRTTVGEER
ncbi:hypothetical protein LTS07_007537 [Exophiala sideris]|uniref:RNase H type-1 domain-containing protein n=1 Tax=Exophiala sideris TaxID=1016849 RepID=A0ABR0J3R0_9EURO|nr:hypothetical protein LTS07_007537 [Exophiala sideris]KAK5033657.1 hypothetical protein LTR13_006709 [Exophiala sideris]KAK5055480.1 hypothetical protein LTR69_008313 [Exophiala sideris]KAK5176434.1 hypothetical protein LTR44_010995 [Eurotiomycetes sp. CCFEE 6388]